MLAANCVINSGGSIKKHQARGVICGSAKSGSRRARRIGAWARVHGDEEESERREYLEEKAGGASVTLTEDDLASIEGAMPRGSAAGERYAEEQMRAARRSR
jgi:hypothetical protein